MTSPLRPLLLLPLLLAGSHFAGGAAFGDFASLRWDDPEIFPPAIFSEGEMITETDIFFRGLEALFPRKVLREPPVLDIAPSREPLNHTLLPGVPYIRVYNLHSALPLIEEMGRGSTLVIDLRYVKADLDSSLAFASLVAQEGETIELIAIGDHPAGSEGRATLGTTGRRTFPHPFFVLTNGETSGPIEAVLSALKENGHIISVGSPTAGNVGSFRQISATPLFYVMNGELRADPTASLVENGFVPAVLNPTPPAEERAGYQALEDGVPIDRLVQTQRNKSRYDEAHLVRDFNREQSDSLEPFEDEDNGQDFPTDFTLQRVHHIVKALQSLGRIPR